MQGKSEGFCASGFVAGFLEASKFVAEFQSYCTSTKATAFDFTMLIPESFSCLILEMWLSESYDSLQRYEATDSSAAEKRAQLKGVGERRWSSMENSVTLLRGLRKEKGQSLEDILHKRRTDGEIINFSLELYKVWLLLTEVINFAELVDSSSHLNFEFKSRDVLPNAVSARHWYKTASKFLDSLTPEQVEYNWRPVRLPGHFSVRADWFLAVASGSRSSRLADHALDLLSSQRSNVTRLQEGIGLPTRRLANGEPSHLRTRLISAEKGQPLKNIEYDDLRRIGAQQGEEDFSGCGAVVFGPTTGTVVSGTNGSIARCYGGIPGISGMTQIGRMVLLFMICCPTSSLIQTRQRKGLRSFRSLSWTVGKILANCATSLFRNFSR